MDSKGVGDGESRYVNEKSRLKNAASGFYSENCEDARCDEMGDDDERIFLNFIQKMYVFYSGDDKLI